MSRTYEIGCSQCKERLWIGQSRGAIAREYVYTLPGDIDNLSRFLFAHVDHPLVFFSSEEAGERETWRSLDEERGAAQDAEV